MAVESWRKSPRSDSEQPCPEGGGGVLQWSVGAFLGLCRHPAARQSCLPVRVLLVADVQRAAGPGPTRVSGPQGSQPAVLPGPPCLSHPIRSKEMPGMEVFLEIYRLRRKQFSKR